MNKGNYWKNRYHTTTATTKTAIKVSERQESQATTEGD